MRSPNQAPESSQLCVTGVFFLWIVISQLWRPIIESSNFHRFVILCICWDTHSEKTGLWQLPNLSSVFNRHGILALEKVGIKDYKDKNWLGNSCNQLIYVPKIPTKDKVIKLTILREKNLVHSQDLQSNLRPFEDLQPPAKWDFNRIK